MLLLFILLFNNIFVYHNKLFRVIPIYKKNIMNYLFMNNRSLFLSLLILSISGMLISCQQKTVNTDGQVAPEVTSEPNKNIEGNLPVACVNVDSLLVNYQFAKDINDKLTKKMEDNRVTLNQKNKRLEADQADFQKKYDNNAFLSQESQNQAIIRIQKQGQELEALMQRMQNEWLMEQNKVNMQLADSTRKAIELINSTGKYEIIFNMRELDNILYAKPKYDITKEVTDLLNSRYQASTK